MGKVDQAHDREDHRQPDGDQRVDAAKAERVDELLSELRSAHERRSVKGDESLLALLTVTGDRWTEVDEKREALTCRLLTDPVSRRPNSLTSIAPSSSKVGLFDLRVGCQFTRVSRK